MRDALVGQNMMYHRHPNQHIICIFRDPAAMDIYATKLYSEATNK